MSELFLSQLNLFPVKSLGGFSVNQAVLSDRGLQFDRRWMLVNPAGHFLSQREFPQMALLQVSLHSDRLDVQHKQFPDRSLEIPFAASGEDRQNVTVWQSRCPAETFSSEIDQWFSDQLGDSCRLVYMPDDSRRAVAAAFQQADEIVSFADGFPLLMIGESSLADLNQRLPEPVSIDRFRTNLVFSGGPPFGEDEWQKIRIGEVEFRVVKPCARCVITTVDPDSGSMSVEPLRTLASFRRDDSGGVMFGQNLLHQGLGELNVGMKIEVLA